MTRLQYEAARRVLLERRAWCRHLSTFGGLCHHVGLGKMRDQERLWLLALLRLRAGP